MNYEIIVDTDYMNEKLVELESNSLEYVETLANLEECLQEIPAMWVGTDSDEFVEKYRNHIEKLKEIGYFYDELIGTIRSLSTEYETMNAEYSGKLYNDIGSEV